MTQTDETTLQGADLSTLTDEETLEALEHAFDYRGDVTLTLADGEELAGYLFDRRKGASLGESFVRVMTAKSDDPVRVAYADVRRVKFTGKDAAHGKSFETWIKKYAEKKRAGLEASIHAEDPSED